MTNHFSTFSDPANIEQDGGKGYNLKILTQNGFNVPGGIVIHANFYKENYPSPAPFSYDNVTDLEKQCEQMKDIVLSTSVTSALISALTDMLDRDKLYAVRSSSTFEDLAGSAFAGQHDTFLNVSFEHIGQKINECFASLWNMHAVKYRHERGFNQEEASMAVVIQQMVDSEVAGVAFSVDPISGAFHRVLIEAANGLGEHVVSGETLTDTWVYDTKANTMTANLAGESPCLSEEQVEEIASLAKKIELHYSGPQDIEWAYYQNEIYLLQSRPQTTIPPYFTRDESAERFPDAVTPLTWDFVEDGFNESLEHSLHLMKIDLPTKPWFAMKEGYIYGNQTAVNILGLKRPLKIQTLDDLKQLEKRFPWVDDLRRNWQSDVSLYLTRIGKLSEVPKRADDLSVFSNYFDALFGAAKEYFNPNIAISMSQSFLVGTLYEALYHIYKDKIVANGKLQDLLSMAVLKTAKVNEDFSKLSDKSTGSKELELFLEKYGHRELGFDYYVPTWADAPDVLTSQNYEMKDDSHTDSMRGIKAMQEVLTKVDAELFPYLYKLITWAIAYTELDDEEHFQTTRVNLLAHRAIKSLGEKVGCEDSLDLFFLRKEELEALLKGTLGADVMSQLPNRKEKFEEIKTNSPVWNWSEGDTEMIETGDNQYIGVPGSAGIVEGDIYIVRDIKDFASVPHGSILVTRTTNPAWTTLFYNAKGIITESGGPLSHGAVTAREVGIPAVMSVRGCLSQFVNGDRVLLDGTRGIVKKV